MKKIFIGGALALSLLACKKETKNIYPKVTVSGYVSGAASAGVSGTTYQAYDRVIYFSIAPDSTGAFTLQPADSVNLAALQGKLTGHQQLFVCVGGPSAIASIAKMAHDSVLRNSYVSALTAFCRRWSLQGVDLDWEMSGTAPAAPAFPNMNDYVNLSQKLSAALHAGNLLFTEAIGVYYTPFSTGVIASDNSYNNLASLTYNYADQVNLIAYGPYAVDNLGYQSTMYQAQNWLGILQSYGVPAQKVSLGVPFNGYHLPIAAVDSTANTIPYAGVVASDHPAPSVNMYINYGFNGISLIQEKVAYLRANGYGGILVSDISQDTTVSCGYSLTRAIQIAN